MFTFQSKFDNPPYRDRVTEKSGTSKKIQWDFQISKVGSADFLDLKVNGSPDMSVTCFDFVGERTFVRYVLRIYNVYHDPLVFK